MLLLQGIHIFSLLIYSTTFSRLTPFCCYCPSIRGAVAMIKSFLPFVHITDDHCHSTSSDHYYDSISCAGWWQCPPWLTSQEQSFSTTSLSIQLPTDLSRSILSTNLSLCVIQKKLEVLILVLSGLQPVKACKYSLHKRTSKVRAQKETVRYQRIGANWIIVRDISTLLIFPPNNEQWKKERESGLRESFIRREKEADSNVTANCLHPGIKKFKA